MATTGSQVPINRTEAAPTTEADPHVLEVLRAARVELDQLVEQRSEITRRIGTAKQAILGLAQVFGGAVLQSAVLELMDHRPNNRQSGFTRACRYLLTEANRPMTSAEVCQGLRRKFPELATRHKDLSASATTVMNRLVGYGEAAPSTDERGRRVWSWVAENGWKEPEIHNPPEPAAEQRHFSRAQQPSG